MTVEESISWEVISHLSVSDIYTSGGGAGEKTAMLKQTEKAFYQFRFIL